MDTGNGDLDAADAALETPSVIPAEENEARIGADDSFTSERNDDDGDDGKEPMSVDQMEADALPPLSSLTCQLCNSYFNEPVTMPCMHSFCKKCLIDFNGGVEFGGLVEDEQQREVQDGEEQEGGGGDQQPPRKKVKPVDCYICEEVLKLDVFSFYAEPFPNDRIARIVRLLHETKILCQNCGSSSSEFRCSVCDAYTCSACWEATHNAPIFKGHVPERLSHSEMTAPPKCEAHPANEVEYFCTDDELGVCQVCLLKGEFKGKDYDLVSDVRKRRQESVVQGVSDALVQRARLIEGKKENMTTLEELAGTLDHQKHAVNENFAQIRAALDMREAQTLEALEKLYESKKRVLEGQIRRIDTEMARIEDGVQNVKLTLRHSNDLEVIYLTYVLQNFINDLVDVSPTSPAGGHTEEGPDHGPAVDEQLPVVLSTKVPQLVGAYASVPDAALVDEIASGATDAQVLQETTATEEQKTILKTVAGSDADAAEYGCTLQ